jgi:3-hydroxyisobutyrate dehydrogenase-like beta-hydroxyacid dehydrogenase
MAKVAFLGLGVMGYPMAGHLAKAGHDLTVFNRTPAKAEAWTAAHGGRHAATPKEAVAGADVVCACVGDDPDVREVTMGTQGAFAAMSPGSVFVDHTTASAALARELEQAARAKGLGFVDAPVSGGQAGAQNGVLTIMCGGAADAFERAKPVISTYARMVQLLGPAGSGQLAKMVNQICIAGLVQGLSEGIDFGLRAGLDMNATLEVISKGAAGSWQMENRGKTMVKDEFDFGFAVDWMRKDLRICLDEAARNGASLAVTSMVKGFYDELSATGGGRWDTSSLIRRLRRQS